MALVRPSALSPAVESSVLVLLEREPGREVRRGEEHLPHCSRVEHRHDAPVCLSRLQARHRDGDARIEQEPQRLAEQRCAVAQVPAQDRGEHDAGEQPERDTEHRRPVQARRVGRPHRELEQPAAEREEHQQVRSCDSEPAGKGLAELGNAADVDRERGEDEQCAPYSHERDEREHDQRQQRDQRADGRLAGKREPHGGVQDEGAREQGDAGPSS